MKSCFEPVVPVLRRLRLAAVAGLTLAGSGCAPQTPALPATTPLAINFQWPHPAAPLTASEAPPPRDVVLRWNPRDYSAREIRDIAAQQCHAFDEKAHAAGVTAAAPAQRSERFACVPYAAAAGASKG